MLLTEGAPSFPPGTHVALASGLEWHLMGWDPAAVFVKSKLQPDNHPSDDHKSHQFLNCHPGDWAAKNHKRSQGRSVRNPQGERGWGEGPGCGVESPCCPSPPSSSGSLPAAAGVSPQGRRQGWVLSGPNVEIPSGAGGLGGAGAGEVRVCLLISAGSPPERFPA